MFMTSTYIMVEMVEMERLNRQAGGGKTSSFYSD